MEALWRNVKNAIKEQLTPNLYRLWIEPIEFAKARGDQMVLACPNFFIKKRIMANFVDLINEELNKTAGQMLTFSLEVNTIDPPDEPVSRRHPEDSQLTLPGIRIQPMNGRILRRDYTFDHFVVGQNSDLA